MDSRREFLKKAAILTGGIGISAGLPPSIQKAMLINPNPGTTFQDAEHIVFLMQENRSFDHVFGNLKGVRGFNDPRAQILPNGNKVWIQSDEKGNSYAPFRLDIKKTQITWQGGLAHDWDDQSGARNDGKYDQWIPFKSPMCMGHYTREDLPFYYALADAFTVCDHSFCASLTGTTPNRLFFWTGTNRPEQNGASEAVLQNHQAESRNNTYVDWQAFPELLEEHAVSWKVYQNELWTADIPGEDNDNWLGNYGDNPLEYIERYNVLLSAYFRKNGYKDITPEQVRDLYSKLSPNEKNLLDKAFTTNINAPNDYLKMSPFSYKDDQGLKQEVSIPTNDIFHQFRKDVDEGTLPTVSWLVAPQKFSDHTSTPLYGMWYISEAMEILTKNPEVWKKTIFILTYDENDGYFDHVSPFVPPKPENCSLGIDTSIDFEIKTGRPMGLGYRIPMIIASPWSKGGYVNSQVFDHTSSLIFLEKFLSHKHKKEIRTKNISPWRRTICGDLTSCFRPFEGKNDNFFPENLIRENVVTSIQKAKDKPEVKAPSLTKENILAINNSTSEENLSTHPNQEQGIKPACALPYQFFVDHNLATNRDFIEIDFEIPSEELGSQATVGSGFHVYTPKNYKGEKGKHWSFAVKAGDQLKGLWKISDFENNRYDLTVTGPNGFYRRFSGSNQDPLLKIQCRYEKKGWIKKRYTGNIELVIENSDSKTLGIHIQNNMHPSIRAIGQFEIQPKEKITVPIDLNEFQNWYNFSIAVNGNTEFIKQYAGHIETGKESISDPQMGGVIKP